METEPPALSFTVELPNSIKLEEKLWDAQPVNPVIHGLPIYAPLAIISIWTGLFLMLNAAKDSGGFIWISIVVIAVLSVFIVHSAVLRKSENKRLNYRKSKIAELVELFANAGYSISEESQKTLTSVLRHSDFKVVTKEGIRYRSDFLDISDEQIKAILFLTDYSVLDKIKRQEREEKKAKRILQLTQSYETKNGEFATAELREAFMEGVRLGSQ